MMGSLNSSIFRLGRLAYSWESGNALPEVKDWRNRPVSCVRPKGGGAQLAKFFIFFGSFLGPLD